MKELTGAQALIRTLEDLGVEIIFGLPGGAILPAYDPLRDSSIRHILVRHEQGAVHAADGYAQASGRPGVCLATSGPGVTNLATGLASAYMDSVPVVAITGQVASWAIGWDAFQETDATGITAPITKYNVLVREPETIPEAIAEAFHIAATGRPGPVLVDIPKDLLQARTNYRGPSAVSLPGYRVPSQPDPVLIEQAARMILASKRPVIYAGGGAVKAKASDSLRRLAELTRIYTVTTLMARGVLDDDHPLCLGMPGMHGNYTAVTAMQKSDLLITLGARFDDRVTGDLEAFAPDAKVIHADIDPAEIGKNRYADLGIVGDVRTVTDLLIEALQIELAKQGPLQTQEWSSKLNQWRRDYPYRYSQPEEGPLKPQFVIEKISEAASQDAIFTSGVGQHQMWASQFIRFRKPRTWINSGGLGAMGFGVPAAMGAALACPNDEVWCIDGDGSFQMTCQELATMTVERIPIKVAIINNSSLGMVRQWQRLFYDGRLSEVDYHEPIPDYVKLAEAYGCVGLRIETVEEVGPAIDKARGVEDRPVVLDFVCDPDEMVFPMIPAGGSNDLIILGPEFEDGVA